MGKSCRVCIIGGAGFIRSSLVKKLLDKDYVVHTTLRNLDDERKKGLLRSLAGVDSRLFLFEADIYEPESFGPGIQCCEFVLLVAIALQHNSHSTKASAAELVQRTYEEMPNEYLKAAGGGNIGLPTTCDQADREYGARNARKSLNKRAKATTLNSKCDMITKELLLIFFHIHMLMA